MGDWLYLNLMLGNFGTLVRAAFGDRRGLDKMLDRLFLTITVIYKQFGTSLNLSINRE
ncbi:MAG: hypothetical protein IJ740_05990 [Ruminococcus sp.]|nr:hypothetical protein [Ruminococcus sp.]